MTRPKLLLADDSVTVRKVVELTFADEGIDVTTAADSETAMQKFVEIQPDIVLVDVGLTEISGYRMCEMIKQDEATNHIPVLLLVGTFEPFDQDEAERAGADGFLTKPFYSIRDLVARVSDLLGHRPSVETAAAETTDLAIDPVVAETTGPSFDSFSEETTDPAMDVFADETTDPAFDPFSEETTDPAFDPFAEKTTDPAFDPFSEETTDPAIGPVAAETTDPAFDAFTGEITDTALAPGAEDATDLEFDEFPGETTDIDSLYVRSFAETVEIDEGKTVEDILDDAGMDDEMIEESYPNAGPSENVLDFVPPTDAAEPTKDFDWSPESLITEGEPPASRFEPKFVFAEPDQDPEGGVAAAVETSAPLGDLVDVPGTIEPEAAADLAVEHEYTPEPSFEPVAAEPQPDETDAAAEIAATEGAGNVAEPSAELISLLTQRIVEKLSDRVIRQIAQEAVPKIAEKLIREALEEDNKS